MGPAWRDSSSPASLFLEATCRYRGGELVQHLLQALSGNDQAGTGDRFPPPSSSAASRQRPGDLGWLAKSSRKLGQEIREGQEGEARNLLPSCLCAGAESC